MVRDGALFMTLYLLCISKLFGGEDDVNLELSVGDRRVTRERAGKRWTEASACTHARLPLRMIS